MALSKKARGAIIGVTIAATFIAIAVWLGASSVERRVHELAAEARHLGLRVEYEPQVVNPKTQKLLAKIRLFVKRLEEGPMTADLDTEEPSELRKLDKAIQEILPDVYALAEGTPHNHDDALSDWGQVLQAFDVLILDANIGLSEGDFSRHLDALAAMRKLVRLIPADKPIMAMLVDLLGSKYCAALQKSAELASEPEQLDALIAEFSKWPILDFNDQARYVIAESFQQIKWDAEALVQGTILERVHQVGQSTHIGQSKRKMFALHDAIYFYPQWQSDRRLLELTESQTIKTSDIGRSFNILKRCELSLQTSLVAAQAVLIARREVSEGKPWPSIDQLEAMGLTMNESVFGGRYEWKEFNGNLRLFGRVQRGLERGDPGILLKSYRETSP